MLLIFFFKTHAYIMMLLFISKPTNNIVLSLGAL